MHNGILHISNGHVVMLKSWWPWIINPFRFLQRIKRLPRLIKKFTYFLCSLGRQLLIPHIILMCFLLVK